MAIVNYDPALGTFQWTKSGYNAGFVGGGPKRYFFIRIQGRTYKASHLAWLIHYGYWPTATVDHINGNSLDDSISNLRECSYRENNSNHCRHRQGYLVGTTYDPRSSPSRPWYSRIKIKGRDIPIGRFPTQQQAHAAYVAEKDRLSL